MLHGWVNVNNELHVVHVNTTGSDVSSDEHLDVAFTEGSEITVTLRLRQVAVQIDCGDTCIG